MTEAFRRDPRMVSIAIHLFIDAFPSGWMKAIMDVERQPKPAYFSYREALTPLMVNLRTDRYAFTAGEEMALEAWVCNDTTLVPASAQLHCQLELEGTVIAAQRTPAAVPACSTAFQGFVCFRVPDVSVRSQATVRLALVSEEDGVLHDTSIAVDVFPRQEPPKGAVYIIGSPEDHAARLARQLGLSTALSGEIAPGHTIVISDWDAYQARQAQVLQAAAEGTTAVFLGFPSGQYDILGDTVDVVPCGMSPRHFCSRATGHPLVDGFLPADFRFWYDSAAGYVTPLLHTTFAAPGWTPILTSGNGDWSSGWGPALAAAERKHGLGRVRICQLALADRTEHNPIARLFARRLLGVD
jgi:hypothetical protein